MKRRDFIQNSALLGLTPYLNLMSLLSESAYAQQVKKSKSLIVIFQRGAVDGLSMLNPYGDVNYSKDIRPNIMIQSSELLKLDSYFGMHPSLAGLKNLWDRGMLSAIHQVGSPSLSRSHFDSQDYLESGTPDVKSTEDGFIARASANLKNEAALKLTSLSVQSNLPRIISGDSKSLSFSELSRFSIKGLGGVSSSNKAGFEDFFDSALDEVLNGQSKKTISLLEDFAKAQKTAIAQDFPKGQLSGRLKDIAKVINSGMYIPFYITEVGGWDTHNNQGNEKGQLANRLKDFSDSIAAFVAEIGNKIEDVTIITVTEFGRTVKENGSRGTDHGHGACYFVINGNVKPKTVHAKWKDIKLANLHEGRDLPVTTDFRDVFADILKTQFGVVNLETVFPSYAALNKDLKIFKS